MTKTSARIKLDKTSLNQYTDLSLAHHNCFVILRLGRKQKLIFVWLLAMLATILSRLLVEGVFFRDPTVIVVGEALPSLQK